MRLPVGQLFSFGFEGPNLDDMSRELLSKEQASGAILFARNITSLEQVVELNTAIIEASKDSYPALISVDQEGGRVARLRDICTLVPSMRKIGELSRSNPDLPYQLGAMMARELSALGFHLDYAPIMDVDTNPNNPIIGDRSFSRDQYEVAQLGARFIEGMQGAGVAACAKHFPGHGDTDTDSHLALPVINHDIGRLEANELVPFQAAIKANVATMMTAHILVKSIDTKHPATLSPLILTNMLRQELGYKGLIISDDLEMKAVADHYGLEEMIRLGLLAGVDMFLICKETQSIFKAIEIVHRLVDAGEVPKERVQEALARVADVKKRFIGAVAAPSLEDARRIVRCAPHLQLAELWS